MIKVNHHKLLIEGRSIGRDILSIFFPLKCSICGESLGNYETICFSCSEKIKVIRKPYCQVCGYPLFGEKDSKILENFICGDCKIHKKWFNVASAAIQYNEQARALIHKYKFQGFISYAILLGRWTLQKYLYDERLGGEELIIPVPLHRSRFKERGFNQAELIANYVSKYTSIPMNTNMLKRIKKTKPQYELTLEERQRNLRNAFKVMDKPLLSDKSVLVIDDIFTTGSTAYEVARTLKKAGARNINFLTVCRALPFV